MRKVIVFIIVVTNITLFAKQIDVDKAKNAGKTFLSYKAELRVKKSLTELQLVYTCTSKQKDIDPETYYYVFNMDSTGFVIVSGTDEVIPILAYSTESTFDPDNIPPNMLTVLNRYEKEIRYVIDNDISGTDDVKRQWRELTSGKVAVHKANAVSVSPLLGEIKWNQNAPYRGQLLYNDSCPSDPAASSLGGKCPAGCVAVAMAQIIKYWGYPTQGTGSNCYTANYATNGYGNYGRLCANFENTTYNYSMMPNELTTNSASAEKRAVAQLIYHCGVAVNMRYGSNGSGAMTLQDDYWIDKPDAANNPYIDARTALKRYFGYTQAEGVSKDDYTEPEWIALLKEQLSNWQPVLYAGRTSNNEGHAFVCDGYDANDYFHINWGWGGLSNCYTTVSSLLPEEQGTGGGSGGFNEEQRAIINIKAVKDEKTLGWVKSDDYVNSYYAVDTAHFILLPDTCLRVYTNLENKSASNVHGIGMTFDPYSTSFGAALFDKSYSYRLDTLQITSLYYLGRNGYNAVHPDTLRIYLSYYDLYSGEPSNGDYRILYPTYPSYPALLPNVRKKGNLQKGDGINPVAANTVVIDYVLTQEDTAVAIVDRPNNFYYKDIKIPIFYNNTTVNGFEVPAGAVIGTMVKFIPGYDYKQGDTLYYGLVSGGKLVDPVQIHNGFGLSSFGGTNNNFIDYNGYNGVNFEFTDLRYQQFHSYLDSCYTLNNNYLPCMSFHITYDIAPTHARVEIDTVLCGGREYVYDGFTYNKSGIYTHRFYTSNGDSIIVINLKIYAESVGVIDNIQGNTAITQAGTYTYSISPVTDAAVYQWTISNPQWTITKTGTGTQIFLDITEVGRGLLSVKAIHANGVCESDVVTLSIDFCNYLGAMTEIQGENFISKQGMYTYSIAPVQNAVSYQWEISNLEWYIIGNSTQPTVDLYINDNKSSGILSVKAIDDCGNYSQKTLNIQSNVLVREYEENNIVQIYPNPVEDIIHVSIENNTLNNVEIYLFDIFGRMLDRQKITDKKTVINMSSFSAGVYFLQIKENEKIIKSTKVVKVE